MGALLTALALAIAWGIFRFERHASRQRDIRGARAVLSVVYTGLVAGWGEKYFETVYTEAEANRRAEVARGAADQVFVVPAEGLAILLRASLAAGEKLISVQTLIAANLALWRIAVFNQLVTQQTLFNAFVIADLRDPSVTNERKRALAEAGVALSKQIHFEGIGSANATGGWFQKLKECVSDDVDRLDELEKQSWSQYLSERRFVVGDVLFICLVAAAILGML